jgi:hypothetical protein
LINVGHWIAIAALCVAIVGCFATVANYLTQRRDRLRSTSDSTPGVKATINGTRYEDGWRSVQLHILPPPGSEQKKFQYQDWCIRGARLLQPRTATLARAQNDDYATGIFFPENPLRELTGKAEGRLQRFALEFFIKFKDERKEDKAEFLVTFAPVGSGRQRRMSVSATVPGNAE